MQSNYVRVRRQSFKSLNFSQIEIFAEHPQQKGFFVRHHGVIPIIEMIDDVSEKSLQEKNQFSEGQAVLLTALQVRIMFLSVLVLTPFVQVVNQVRR